MGTEKPVALKHANSHVHSCLYLTCRIIGSAMKVLPGTWLCEPVKLDCRLQVDSLPIQLDRSQLEVDHS